MARKPAAEASLKEPAKDSAESAPPVATNIPRDDLLKLYRDMLLIRRFEEKAGQLNLLADPFRWMPTAVNPLDGTGDPARVTALIREGKVGSLFNGIGAEAGGLGGGP